MAPGAAAAQPPTGSAIRSRKMGWVSMQTGGSEAASERLWQQKLVGFRSGSAASARSFSLICMTLRLGEVDSASNAPPAARFFSSARDIKGSLTKPTTPSLRTVRSGAGSCLCEGLDAADGTSEKGLRRGRELLFAVVDDDVGVIFFPAAPAPRASRCIAGAVTPSQRRQRSRGRQARLRRERTTDCRSQMAKAANAPPLARMPPGEASVPTEFLSREAGGGR